MSARQFTMQVPDNGDVLGSRAEIDHPPYNGWTGGGLGERHRDAVRRHLRQFTEYARHVGVSEEDIEFCTRKT